MRMIQVNFIGVKSRGLFWLVLANVGFVWNPLVFAGAINSHKLQRSTNWGHNSSSARLSGGVTDLLLDILPNRIDGCFARVQSTCGSQYGQTSIEAILARTAYHRGRSQRPVSCDRELHGGERELASIAAIDDYTHDLPLSDCNLSGWKVGSENAFQQWDHLFDKGGYSIFQRAFGLERTFRDAFKISFAPIDLANQGEVHLANVRDLTHIGLSVPVAIRRSAVRGDGNLFIGSQYRDGCPVRKVVTARKKGDTEKEWQPKWIRHRYVGLTTSCWVDGADGPETCSERSIDVDVSKDGKIWFHAFGESCLDQLRQWK
jgi:hypothetical protein